MLAAFLLLAGGSVGHVQLVSANLAVVEITAPTQRLFLTDGAAARARAVGPTLPSNSRIDDFAFADREHGWVAAWNLDDVGVTVYRTSDGGRRWRRVDVTSHSMAAGSVATIQFLDRKHGWLVNQQPTAPDASLYATVDGGASWRLVRRGLPEVAPVRFTSAREAWQTGDFSSHRVFHTADGGRTWTRVRKRFFPPGRYRCAVASLPASRVRWVTAYRSGGWDAYLSADAGISWRRTTIVQTQAPKTCAYGAAIDALDAKTAWFVVDGRLFATRDASGRWRRLR